MRPARIIAAVVLTVAAAAAGSYAAYSSSHPSGSASATTAPSATTGTSPSATTTAPTIKVTSPTSGVSHAACSSQAILPLLKRKFDNPAGELTIVRADIKRCRSGYAHVFAISGRNPPGHPQYENEQLFLRDVNGSWQSVAEGTGIACSDADITAAMLRACRALDYPTHTTPTPTPRTSDPQVAANRLVDAWMHGDKVTARNLTNRTVTDRLFSESPPAKTPAALPCRLAHPAMYLCSYTLAEHAELTIIVEGGASAGYGVSGVEFGD
jgi:hypothetical protein